MEKTRKKTADDTPFFIPSMIMGYELTIFGFTALAEKRLQVSEASIIQGYFPTPLYQYLFASLNLMTTHPLRIFYQNLSSYEFNLYK